MTFRALYAIITLVPKSVREVPALNKLNNTIDRFCLTHPRFGIANLMLYIAISNVVVFVLDMFSNSAFSNLLYFSLDKLMQGQIWRLVTFILIPEGGGPISVLISCYFYYWIGSSLERQWGTAKFTCYYIGGMLFTLLGTVAIGVFFGFSFPVASAHYVNFAMFLAFAMLWPDAQILLFFVIPLKIKYLAYFDLAYFAYCILNYIARGVWYFSILPVVALLNFVIFFWPELLRFFHVNQARRRPEAVRFRSSAAQVKRESRQANTGLRKCAVCGRTNQTNPELDFRYCSRCAGYHCFCSDHIFSHIHFTDDQP